MSSSRYYRSQSLSAQWDDLSQSISSLLVEPKPNTTSSRPETAFSPADRPQITTKHWVDSAIRSHCTGKDCGKKFTLTERRHHCRKCGEVFCGRCTMYRKRLSSFATPDCDGILYRVCRKCFDVGPQTLGAVRNKLNEFKTFKTVTNSAKKNINNNPSTGTKIKINYEQECQRLVEGFRTKLKSWKIKNFVAETFGVPEWQRSYHWVEKSEQCLLCYKTFSLTDLKSHCRVCGKIICSSCSSDLLIVYLDDKDNVVKWCLINIIGSPDQEPIRCLYLKICNLCHSELAEIQGRSSLQTQKMEVDGKPVVEKLADIDQLLSEIQKKVWNTLPKFEQLVDAVEAKGDLKGLIQNGQSATQMVAKYHLDLSDLFTKFAVNMQSLKKLKPQTNTQVKLAKNFTSSKFCFYNDHFPMYRQSKRRVEDVLPLDVLEGVQKIVDEQAINSAYIVIKQLGFEALLLVSSHKIDELIPSVIASCEEICFGDLQKQLDKDDSDWKQHLQTVNELLHIQLKSHRLVKPSSRKSSAFGANYVRWFLLDRTFLLLSQTIRQLNDKTADKKFKLTKNALLEAQEKIDQLRG